MLRAQLTRFVQQMGVRYVVGFFPLVLQVPSLMFWGWYIVDWDDMIDRVSPPDKLNTNPVQESWNMFPRTHISIFIHPKQELHGFWGYITSKYWYFWFKINHFFGPFLGLFGVFQNFFMIHFWINEPNLDDSFSCLESWLREACLWSPTPLPYLPQLSP